KMPGQVQVKAKKPQTGLGAFALGIPFGLVITPCTIPIFIMIITYVAFTGSTVHGALLFATYAIGKVIILAVVASSSSAFLTDFRYYLNFGSSLSYFLLSEDTFAGKCKFFHYLYPLVL